LEEKTGSKDPISFSPINSKTSNFRSQPAPSTIFFTVHIPKPDDQTGQTAVEYLPGDSFDDIGIKVAIFVFVPVDVRTWLQHCLHHFVDGDGNLPSVTLKLVAYKLSSFLLLSNIQEEAKAVMDVGIGLAVVGAIDSRCEALTILL
jgi:hypothetical protein